jgi:NADH:ubiquinone oxidoreductase subunit 6 (subunit J)
VNDPGVVTAFWVLSGATIGGALMVVVSRNLIHAVLYLVLSFIGVAGLYLTLSADFVAVVQVLIYAGAISVLMLFAIMLTPRASRDNAETVFRVPALVLAVLVTVTIIFVTIETDWREAARGPFDQTAAAIGEAILDPFVLPFEVASVMLVAAMIGAIMLVRED